MSRVTWQWQIHYRWWVPVRDGEFPATIDCPLGTDNQLGSLPNWRTSERQEDIRLRALRRAAILEGNATMAGDCPCYPQLARGFGGTSTILNQNMAPVNEKSLTTHNQHVTHDYHAWFKHHLSISLPSMIQHWTICAQMYPPFSSQFSRLRLDPKIVGEGSGLPPGATANVQGNPALVQQQCRASLWGYLGQRVVS